MNGPVLFALLFVIFGVVAVAALVDALGERRAGRSIFGQLLGATFSFVLMTMSGAVFAAITISGGGAS